MLLLVAYTWALHIKPAEQKGIFGLVWLEWDNALEGLWTGTAVVDVQSVPGLTLVHPRGQVGMGVDGRKLEGENGLKVKMSKGECVNWRLKENPDW